MTDPVVVEAGPGTVRGSNDIRPEWVSVALGCIDDDIALLNDRPVSVQEVWGDVMRAAVGSAADAVVLVCPSWWSSSRIDRVRAAAFTVTTTVVVRKRTPLLRDGVSDRRTTIVEIAPEFIVVSGPAVVAVVVPRRDGVADTDAVLSAVGASAAVLVDAPTGVAGAELLGATIADRLRDARIAVTFADQDLVRRSAAAPRTVAPAAARRPRARRDRRWAVALVSALSAMVLCGGLAVGTSDSPTGETPMTFLVEGRVAVLVPAVWKPQRITSGPGSARVQLVSPTEPSVVLHVTQSTSGPRSNLAVVADSVRAALDMEPDGVFVDFNPSDLRADRPAVTYREVRPDHHVGWVVLVDDTVRIAIGCQSAPGREALVHDVCDSAVRSAHVLF